MIQPERKLDEAYQIVKEELVRLSAPTADEVHDLIKKAMDEGDVKTIRSEGHHWSGHIALVILELADCLEGAVGSTRRGKIK